MALVFMGAHGWGTLFIDPSDIEAGVGLQSSFTKVSDGTAATHYVNAAGGSPSTGPVTADANGRLVRWIEEGIYNQTLPGGAVVEVHAVSGAVPSDATTLAVTNLRKRAWWSQPSGKLRFDAPAGVCVVTDPFYGSASRAGTSSALTATAIKNASEDAFTEALGRGGEVWFPSGQFLVNDQLMGPTTTFRTQQTWRGAGRESTYIILDTAANLPNGERPIIDHQQPTGEQGARVYLHDLNFQSMWRSTSADPYTTDFPLVRIGSGDLAEMNRVYFMYAHGDGLHIRASTLGGTSASDSWRLNSVFTALNKSYGIRLDNGADLNTVISGGSHQYNFGGGIILKGGGGRLYGQCEIRGTRIEGNGGYAIFLEHQDGVLIHGNYLLKNDIYLDEQTTECWVMHNNLLDATGVAVVTGQPRAHGCYIIDAGFGNVTEPNEGMTSKHPEMTRGSTVEDLMPASQLPDGEGARSEAAIFGWTASGATLTKAPTSESTYRLPKISRGAILRFAQTSAGTAGGARATVPVTASDSYLFQIFWTGGLAAAPGLRVVLSDNGTGTSFHDTGIVTSPGGVLQDAFYSRPHALRFCARIPAGTTTLRVDVFGDCGSTSRQGMFRGDMIKLPVANAHFGGTYTAGLAEGWTKRGVGTLTEETSGHDATVGYAKAQRLAIAAGASDALGVENLQSPLPNATGFMVAKARVFIPTGQADPNITERVELRIGAFMDNTANWIWRQRAHRVGVWETLMRVYKTGATGVNIVSVGLEKDATFAGEVIVQEAYAIPLREHVSERSIVSPEMDLSGAAQSFMVGVLPMDSVLRSVTVVYTEATSVDAGVQIRVGDSVNATAYAAVTSGTSKALDSTLDVIPLRTDLRGGVPIRVSHPGGKVGTGNVVVVLRYV